MVRVWAPGKRVAYAAVLLWLLTAGCASVKSDALVSTTQIVATQPDTPKPAAKPAAPRTPQPEPARAPAPSARTAAPSAASKGAPPAATTLAKAATLDLAGLEQQLRATKAIGIFTKITLKNQVDDLLDRFRDYHQGKAKVTKTDLRRAYDLLIMKVLSLLQDEDQRLASAIVSSREAIWGLLEDPKKFATLQG
jgi:pyruvate/2-oxoglutarate dehydrogenase complex dihydrolipoamide acyltransferase (E2) component